MNKKVFISYSRKDTLDIAEFKTIKKFRGFEIVIDDEEIPFNKLWKDNIRQKINDSDAAIFFISKNALNPESPIRSLEIPLISKRLRDPDDDFNFFPIFLEDVEKELDSYTFTTLKDSKEVKFLDFFQIYDIEKQNTLENLSSRMRKRFFRNINANITQVLKGGTLSPGQELITKLSRIQKIRWALGVLSVVLGLGWFTTTDAYARILIAAYEQRIESGEVDADSATVRFLAEQLDSVENLDSLTNDESLKESIAEVAELNLNLNLEDDLQNIDLSGSVEDSTTTTLGTTTTTLGTTTTTLGTTNSVDTDAPTFDKGLTAENITYTTVDISWSAVDNVGISYYTLREGSFVIYQGSNTSKEVEGLTSGKKYTFSVDAYDAAGNFSTSDVIFTTWSSNDSSSSSTSTTTSTTTTTIVDNVGPTISGFSVAEVNTWNAKLVWNASDDSGILKYSISCSKSENAAIAQSFTQEIGTGGRNYFWINSGSNDPWDTSGDEIEYWSRDHDFDATCTLTAYDNSPNQNTSSSTISWHTERVPTGFFLDDANWVASDQICIKGGTSYTNYLNVDVVIRANGVQKNTYSNTSGGFLVTGLSADTNYTISVTFTDQYGRSETLESSHASLNTFTSNSRYWSSVYGSFPSACYGISASPTTTTTTTTTLPTTIGPTLNSLSISEDWLFENDQLTYNYSASPGTLDWGGNERIYFELSNGYVSPKVYCNIWKGSNVSSGSYSYQLSNSSDCSQNGRYFLDKVKVRAGISNPAEITYDLITGLVSCDSNWLNYSSEPCPSSHSFSRYSLSPFYNAGDSSGLDQIAYHTCTDNGDGTFNVSLRAVYVSGPSITYWRPFYSTDNNSTYTYLNAQTINVGSEHTFTIATGLNSGVRIITHWHISKYPYYFLTTQNSNSLVLNSDNCS